MQNPCSLAHAARVECADLSLLPLSEEVQVDADDRALVVDSWQDRNVIAGNAHVDGLLQSPRLGRITDGFVGPLDYLNPRFARQLDLLHVQTLHPERCARTLAGWLEQVRGPFPTHPPVSAPRALRPARSRSGGLKCGVQVKEGRWLARGKSAAFDTLLYHCPAPFLASPTTTWFLEPTCRADDLTRTERAMPMDL